MKGKTYNNFSKMHRLLNLLAPFVVLLLIAGCAGGNYGRMERDRGLDNKFLSYEVLPDHRYYTTGGYDAPNAILAVHRDYELDNPGNLWIPIPNVDTGQMRKWIETIGGPEKIRRMVGSFFAAYILDPDGNRVGAWFAVESETTVKFFEGRKIQVYTPRLNQDIFQDKMFRFQEDDI